MTLSVTEVPEVNEAEQPWLLPVWQEIPCGLLATAPVPVPLKLIVRVSEVVGGVPPCEGVGREEVPNALHPIKKASADSSPSNGRTRTMERGISTSTKAQLPIARYPKKNLRSRSFPVSRGIRNLGFPIAGQMRKHRRDLECHLVAH